MIKMTETIEIILKGFISDEASLDTNDMAVLPKNVFVGLSVDVPANQGIDPMRAGPPERMMKNLPNKPPISGAKVNWTNRSQEWNYIKGSKD